MGISIRIPGAVFKNAVTSLIIPDRSGLINEFVLGNDETQSTRNLANLDAPASVIGAPIYSDHYVRVGDGSTGPGGAAAGFLTAVPDDGQHRTMIALAVKEPTALNYNAVYVCGMGSSGYPGSGGILGLTQYSLANNGGATYFNGNTGPGGPNIAEINVPASSKFRFMAGWGSVGDGGAVTVGVAGELVEPVEGSTAGAAATRYMQIGGAISAVGGDGQMRVAYVAHFQRVLDIEEIAAIYDGLKAFYDGKIEIE